MATRGVRLIPTAGGNLFGLSALHLGSAEQWTRIAEQNGIDDPWLSEVRTLRVPFRSPYGDNSGILYPTYRLTMKPAVTPDPVPETPPLSPPPARAMRFDRLGAGFRFDAAGPDAPTFDQQGIAQVPGGVEQPPVDPPPVDPPPVEQPPTDPVPVPVSFTFDASVGVTFDAATGPTFDEGPPEPLNFSFDKTAGQGFDATTGPGFDQG
jgi:hypothetical protein